MPPPPHTGLSEAEAAQRLKAEGPNELPRARRRTLGRIVLEAGRDPMSQFLLAGVAIYLLLGDVHEALVLGLFVLVTIGLSVVQQQRTERVLEALQDLASPRALVLRGGERRRIPGREVVRGDLLLIGEGDRVAADGVLLSAHALETDESLLTGESVPVRKVAEQDVASARARMGEGSRPGPGSGAASGAASAAVPTTVSPAASAQPGGDGQPFVWAGSVVVKGQGIAQVTATGAASAMGRIGQALRTIDTPDTPLTVQTRRLVRLAAVGGAGASLLFVLAFGLTRGDWLAALLGGVTLAMSLLPEEFSLILTVFMAMGAWRLSHQRVLARRPAAIEALGAATVLCTDKTGTLTWNRMAVTDLAVPDFALSDCGMPGSTPADPAKPAAAHPLAQEQPALQVWTADEAGLATPLPEAFHALLEAAVLASQPEPFDPMERAFHALGQEHLGPDHGHEGWELVHAWGLTPELLAMSHAWRAPGQDTPVISAKGAPEAIALLCRLSPAQAAVWREAAQQFTARGKRVLAVARAVATAQTAPGAQATPANPSAPSVQTAGTTDTAEPRAPWPATPHGFEFQPLGLVALADPLRPEVPAAVAECRRAGVRVAMVTGDHPGTALAIAAQAGIDTAGGVLTGADIEAMDETALREQALRTSVFARVMPQQKLKLVQALRAGGRRRERRPGAEGRAHRHRHGPARHRRGARGRQPGADGGRLQRHRQGLAPGPAHSGQRAQGHGVRPGRARAHRRPGPAAAAAGLAAAAHTGAHRVS
jgi:Ca2+-transporting ATPase